MKDPIKDNPSPAYKPMNGKKSPWDFTCPSYDERSGPCVNAGTNHGVGHRQPVGTKGTSMKGSPIPYGRIETMRVDDVR